MECQAVVMAAGKGSRMLDLTASQQKCMLPVGNMPMIWFSLNYLQNSGFQEAIVISNESEVHIYKAMEEKISMRLDVVKLPSDDYGTADSLRYIEDKIKSDVLVISSDLVTDFPLHKLLDVYRLHGASLTALFSVIPNYYGEMSTPGPRTKQKYEKDYIGIENKTGRIVFSSSEADFKETIPIKKSIIRKHPSVQYRNNLLDAHLYVIKKWVIEHLTRDTNISTIKGELVPMLVKKQFISNKTCSETAEASAKFTKLEDVEMVHRESEEEWNLREMSTWNDHSGDLNTMYHGDNIRCYSIIADDDTFLMRANTKASFLELNKQIVGRWSKLDACKNIPMVPSSVICKSKHLGCNQSVIGDCTELGDKISIKHSVIGKHCKIGDKVKIFNSVILNYVEIANGCTVQGSIICDNATIGSNSELKDSVVGTRENIPESSKHSHETLGYSDETMDLSKL